MYNLRYKDSFEQDKYAASLRREQAIFEELIRAKGHMVLPDLQQARLTPYAWPSHVLELQLMTCSPSNADTCAYLGPGPASRQCLMAECSHDWGRSDYVIISISKAVQACCRACLLS